MTPGVVHDLQARVNVVFRLLGRQEIDANLANDADVKTSVHVATVVWEGQEVEVAVLAMGRRPLLGTAPLRGRRLCADLVEGGEVTVGPRP